MTETVYTVKGMTCGHCASSVREEVGQLGGVTDVAVDLPTGQVRITSENALNPADVKAAVDEAGYEVVA